MEGLSATENGPEGIYSSGLYHRKGLGFPPDTLENAANNELTIDGCLNNLAG